jgi:hypothetical protein
VHRWLAQYGGMKASDAKRLEELEAETPCSMVLIGDDEGWCSAVRVGLLPPVTVDGLECCRPCCPGAADLWQGHALRS